MALLTSLSGEKERENSAQREALLLAGPSASLKINESSLAI
jgi:hypothetical protein